MSGNRGSSLSDIHEAIYSSKDESFSLVEVLLHYRFSVKDMILVLNLPFGFNGALFIIALTLKMLTTKQRTIYEQGKHDPVHQSAFLYF